MRIWNTVRRVAQRIDSIAFPGLEQRVVATKQWIRSLFWRMVLCRTVAKFCNAREPLNGLGPLGEREAERYLLRQGMIILFRGYHDRVGEVDLIAVDHRTVVFVEVKTRSSDIAGEPEEAVDGNKQTKLTKTAIGFLKWHRLTECAARFDVVAIRWPDISDQPEIKHYVNAFEPVGEFQFFS
jgi:putative endonuclease